MITGRRENPLQSAVDALGTAASYELGDVTIAADRKRWLSQIREANGTGPSIIVNNAGQNAKAEAIETTDEELESLLRTHVVASFALSGDVQPGMAAAGGDSILFFASMASFLAVPKVVGYTAGKTSVLGIVRSLAAEWSTLGIRVNAFAPGWIVTPMTAEALNNDSDRKAKVLGRILAGGMGQAGEVGTAAVFLSSASSSYVCVQCLTVDGGASVGF